MTAPECPIDGKPIPDNAYICHGCGGTLHTSLMSLAVLHDELEVTRTRQARIGSTSGGRGSSEPPLMFHYGASEAAFAVTGSLTTWARHISEERGVDIPDIPKPVDVGPIHRTDCKHHSCAVIRWHISDSIEAHAAKFIAGHVQWLRHRPEAEEAHGDLTDALRLLETTIDRPAPRQYAGPCDVCRKDMYAKPGAAVVECRECALVYDMQDRREYLLKSAEDNLYPAALIARAVTNLGEEVTPSRIRLWAHRGRLVAHAHEGSRPLYRLGDVLVLLHGEATRKAG